eukprot:2228627-Rhodomonas_salina.1
MSALVRGEAKRGAGARGDSDLPAQSTALAADAHRMQVLELGQRPAILGAVPTEQVSCQAERVTCQF